MRAQYSKRFATLALLVGGLACAGNQARTADEDTDQAAAARDTTSRDTLGGDTQNPPGYRGMERDTTIAPQGQPSDTFLQNQGQGQAQDTAGYSGMERVDTTGQANQQGGQSDTTGAAAGGQDTTGAWGADTSGANQSGAGANQSGADTSAQSRTGDTTGYDQSQQQSQDTTSAQ